MLMSCAMGDSRARLLGHTSVPRTTFLTDGRALMNWGKPGLSRVTPSERIQ